MTGHGHHSGSDQLPKTDQTPYFLADVRGLSCPWPVLKLAKFMRAHNHVMLLTDDPKAPDEIVQFCNQHGWDNMVIPLKSHWEITVYSQ